MLYLALRISKEVWFVPAELSALTLLFGGSILPFVLRWCSEKEGRWVWMLTGVLLAWAGSMLFPFLYKWNQVGPSIYPQGHGWMIEAGFLRTRLTLAGYAMVLFFGLNGLWGSREKWFPVLAQNAFRRKALALQWCSSLAQWPSLPSESWSGHRGGRSAGIGMGALTLLARRWPRFGTVGWGHPLVHKQAESGPVTLITASLCRVYRRWNGTLAHSFAKHISQKHVVDAHRRPLSGRWTAFPSWLVWNWFV